MCTKTVPVVGSTSTTDGQTECGVLCAFLAVRTQFKRRPKRAPRMPSTADQYECDWALSSSHRTRSPFCRFCRFCRFGRLKA